MREFLRKHSLKLLAISLMASPAMAKDFNLNVTTGWNDVALPFSMGQSYMVSDLAGLASQQGIDIAYVARWDGNSWRLFIPGVTGGTGDIMMDRGEGFFIYSMNAGQLMFSQPMHEFTIRLENIGQPYPFTSGGTFAVKEGAASPGPLFPGDAYEFDFHAGKGQRLSFATMFGASNDFFFGPDGAGIPLFDGNGDPMSGDVTSMVQLWDSGTEENQEPGLGSEQPALGSGNTPDPDNTVRLAPDDFGNLPAVADCMAVTLTSTNPPYGFRLRIENVSTASTLQTSDGNSGPVPISPGVWVVHTSPDPLFASGFADRGEGLKNIAEGGDIAPLWASVQTKTGVTPVLSPCVSVIHTATNPIFTSGELDRGEGLERIAEEGDTGVLAPNLMGKPGIMAVGVANTPKGAAGPGPITPGNAYEWTVMAAPGDMFSFASMYGQSNDCIVANGQGIALFDAGDMPVSGNYSSAVLLWDAGTEMNEIPGIGMYQAPRQPAADMGMAESRQVNPVNDGFWYGNLPGYLSLTITAN